jgi:hypothetical protein
MTHRAHWRCGLAAALALGGAGVSLAAEPAPSAMAILHWTETPDAQPPAPARAAGPPQSDSALGDLAGRGADNVSVALTEQSLSALNTGNTIQAGSVTSGAISLQDNALSGFSGISNVMMNTGHNNNLQSNMSVTVIITP